MKILYLMHIYQPPYQSKEILKKIVEECYKKIIAIVNESNSKIVMNINGSLTELLYENGYLEIIESIKEAAANNKIEFVSSAAYHAILPLLPKHEIKKQIQINDEINKGVFGNVYNPSGFYFPEMCYSPEAGRIVSELGYKWTIIDEIAYNKKISTYPKNCIFRDNGLSILLRNRNISNALAFSIWRESDVYNIDQLISLLKQNEEEISFLSLATDGEVYGHHKKGRETLLYQMLDHSLLEFCDSNELFDHVLDTEDIVPYNSSWSSRDFELDEGNPYSLWKSSDNELHELQWDLVYLALKCCSNEFLGKQKAGIFDKSLASDQFFWASCRPWWNYEMVCQGAKIVADTINSSGAVSKYKNNAKTIYSSIIAMAEKWEKEGIAKSKRFEFLKRAGITEDKIENVLM